MRSKHGLLVGLALSLARPGVGADYSVTDLGVEAGASAIGKSKEGVPYAVCVRTSEAVAHGTPLE